MSEDKTAGLYNTTAPALLSFPNLLEAKAVMRGGKARGEPKYSINIELAADHPDLKPMKAKMVAVARAKWPGVDLSTLTFPITDGDKLADKAAAKGKDREWSRGLAVLTSRSQFEPQLAAVVNGALKDFADASRAAAKPYFYNGVNGLVEVNFVAYDAVDDDGKPGVTAYLQKVCSLNTGKKLSGGQSASEVFKGYVGLKSATDPTAGMQLDDEIPF